MLDEDEDFDPDDLDEFDDDDDDDEMLDTEDDVEDSTTNPSRSGWTASRS
jgi:hypothetical protein